MKSVLISPAASLTPGCVWGKPSGCFSDLPSRKDWWNLLCQHLHTVDQPKYSNVCVYNHSKENLNYLLPRLRWHLNLPDLTWLGIRSTDSAGCTRPFMASNLWMLGTEISLHKKDDTKTWKHTFGKAECWWYTHRHDGQQPGDHPNLRPPQSAGCNCHIYLSIGGANKIFIIFGKGTY